MTPLQSRMHTEVCLAAGLTACLCGSYARVAAQAVAEELEACAKIAGEHGQMHDGCELDSCLENDYTCATNIAAAIRSRATLSAGAGEK